MSSEQHKKRVRALFDVVIELPPEKRELYLELQCAGEPEVRRELDELIAHDTATKKIRVEPVLDRMEPEADPTQIDKYKILGRLGEGGFGDVFEAEQTEPFHRKVALKVVKAGMDTRAVLDRFEVERQALAHMSHPGIARVFDAGTTERGRSYFVMELVDGRSITQYADSSKLSIAERLDLFRSVCDAVRHAHQRGIIHRDLKPSNILVTSENGKPLVKVIDFGIAKATGGGLSNETMFTEEGVFVGTPEYMSPEQAGMGGDIDVRTDVYSLGVLLYELLTGALPVDAKTLRSSSIARMQEIIQSESARRPSTRMEGEGSADRAANRSATPARLARELRGDLDWIVLKALEKERDRRYESASALAMDIERYERDEPVEAGPPSVGYRARKFAKRYRVPLAVAGIVLASIGYAFFETNRQRVVAERALEEAEEMSRFLTSMLSAADPRSEGKDVTVRAMLEKGAGTVREDFAERPLVKARLLFTIGKAFHSLGLFQDGRPFLEEAVATREDLLPDDDPDLAFTNNVFGMTLFQLGEMPEARAHYQRAIDVWKNAYGTEHQNVATALNNLANTYWATGEYDEALPIMRMSLAIREKVRGPDHLDVAQSLNNLGALAATTGDFAGSAEYFERALVIREKRLPPDHPDISQTIYNIGTTKMMAGDHAGGVPYFERALAVQEKTLGPKHVEVALSVGALANAMSLAGRFAEADAQFERSLAIQREALGPEHADVGRTLAAYGYHERRKGNPAQAREYLERGLRLLEKAGQGDHDDAVKARRVLGEIDEGAQP
ncbi:MAG: serine/threonine protein kinase [Gemmatimonadetes bacterium]|nr:serine/threonine protein kinase [Gemmatimonadota bacterium]